jgi:hypothetical protein
MRATNSAAKPAGSAAARAGTYYSTTTNYTYWFVNTAATMVNAQAVCYTNFTASLVWYTSQAEYQEVESYFSTNAATTGWASNNYWVGAAIRPGGLRMQLHACPVKWGLPPAEQSCWLAAPPCQQRQLPATCGRLNMPASMTTHLAEAGGRDQLCRGCLHQHSLARPWASVHLHMQLAAMSQNASLPMQAAAAQCKAPTAALSLTGHVLLDMH